MLLANDCSGLEGVVWVDGLDPLHESGNGIPIDDYVAGTDYGPNVEPSWERLERIDDCTELRSWHRLELASQRTCASVMELQVRLKGDPGPGAPAEVWAAGVLTSAAIAENGKW